MRRRRRGGTLAKSSPPGVQEAGQNRGGGVPAAGVPLSQGVTQMEYRGGAEPEPEWEWGRARMTSQKTEVIARGIVEPIGMSQANRSAARVTRSRPQHDPETKPGFPGTETPVDVFK